MSARLLAAASLAAVLLVALTPGCIKFVAPAALAPSTTPLDPEEYWSAGQPVRGEADGIIVFGVPISTSDTVLQAREDALRRAGPQAEALVNVSVSYITTIYFGIVTVTNTWVWGEPVRRRVPPPASGPSRPH